jgi:Uma2 family endonuclease
MSTVMASETSARSRSLVSAAEFARLARYPYAELVRGEIVEMPPAQFRHGFICMRLATRIGAYLEQHPSGWLVGNDTGIITTRNPDSVRGADLAYYSYDRLPANAMPTGYAEAAPNLVVEVKSPGNRWAELQEKAQEYLRAGVDIVLLIDPEVEVAEMIRQTLPVEVVSSTDSIRVTELLPGFEVSLAELLRV